MTMRLGVAGASGSRAPRGRLPGSVGSGGQSVVDSRGRDVAGALRHAQSGESSSSERESLQRLYFMWLYRCDFSRQVNGHWKHL